MAGELEISDGGDALVALITVPDEKSASKLSEALVGSEVCACVNMIPGPTSVYRWKGEICRDSEWLLIAKTVSGQREEMAKILSEHHPYDEPELLFLPVDSGSATYLSWLREQVGASPKS